MRTKTIDCECGELHLVGGNVCTVCPDCGHKQPVFTPAGEVSCDRCKMSIRYDTGLDDNSFLRLRVDADRNPERYKKVG